MPAEQEKMRGFIERLWANPAVQSAPLADRESHILNFVKSNQAGLREAFGRPEYFPGMAWEKAMTLLLTELNTALESEIRPRLAAALDRSVHPAVREAYQDQGGVEIDSGALRSYLEERLSDRRVRAQLATSIETLESGLLERYGKAIVDRRRTIFFELTRRDRLSIEPGYLSELLRLVVLLRPIYAIKISRGFLHDAAVADHARNPRSWKNAMQAAAEEIRDRVGYTPDAVLAMALESFLSAADNPDLSGTARLVAILCARAQDLRRDAQAHDRGAETPDKSWFSINRRIARSSGLDGRFLEELYLIAGEEGW